MDLDPPVCADRSGSVPNVVPLRLTRECSEIGALVGPFWSESKTLEALAVENRDTLAEMRETGALLGMETADGHVVYPVIQFETRDGAVWVKPDLVQFFTALTNQDAWTIGVLLHTPAPELGGLTPLMWVSQKMEVDTLLDFARRLAHEWSH